MKKVLSLLAAMPLLASAQTLIDFESEQGYKALGIYDAWEASPFRSGELRGNWAVTENPDTTVNDITGEAANPSAMVLGAQRSRFGSNRFGVRIDLDSVLSVSPETQYVHVMIHKPAEGRVMLIGLGSRVERTGQNPYCEQFWQLSANSVGAGKWQDAVFAVRTAAGVSIRSLVVVPDCESPHNLTEDFLFYIDDIEVNASSAPRIVSEFYPINGDKENTAMTRTDRMTSAVAVTPEGGKRQRFSVKQSANHLLYQNLLDKVFYAKAGQAVTPEITYSAGWMHAYCYVDLNRNGKFDPDELLSYNYLDGKNSLGDEAPRNPGTDAGKMPAFTLPETTEPGLYRMRLKMDWDCADPAGNPGEGGSNEICSNGGSITDVMFCVYADEVTLNDFQLNGEVLAADGSKLSDLKAPADAPFAIKSAPEKGFHNGGITVKCGYNLTGDETDRFGNPQYTTWTIRASAFDADGVYTIPADKMRANLLFNGIMLEDEEDAIETPEATTDTRTTYYDLRGIPSPYPASGRVYITSDGRKIMMRHD